MPLGVGVDLVEVARIARALERHRERFVERIYTPAEAALCAGRPAELAARFAGKEAVSKALGTGIAGFSWRDIEILSEPAGKPVVVLHGRAAARAQALGLTRIEISLSHTRDLAVALVVGL
jgi:holo-[acyl-carrier protein] synthase